MMRIWKLITAEMPVTVGPISVPNASIAKDVLISSEELGEGDPDKQAINFLEADSSLPYLREVLGPVLLEKSLKKCFSLERSLAQQLLRVAFTQLEAEVNRALEPYPDWTRPCPEPETERRGCPIQELATFMADPEAKSHDFRRNQGDRSRITEYISQYLLDLDHKTIEKGRPYTLACTKTDNSYHRALALRAEDEALLAKLNGL